MNEAADAFFGRLVHDDRLDEQKTRVAKTLRRAGDRVRASIEGVRRDMASAEEADAVLRKGELLLAHLDEVGEKARAVSVQDTGGPLEIALDPRLSPSENAQKYFRRYKKLKRRASTALARLQEMEEEEKFIGALAFDLESADEVEDVLSVERALSGSGYAGRKGGRRTGDARPKGRPAARAKPYRRFVSPAGWEVIVGRKRDGQRRDAQARGTGERHMASRARGAGQPRSPAPRGRWAARGAGPGNARAGGGVRGLVQPGPDGFQAHRRLSSLLRA